VKGVVTKGGKLRLGAGKIGDAFAGLRPHSSRMPPPGSLRVIDAAEQLAVDVNRMLKSRRRSLTYAEQLKRAVGSIGANLVEGYGRGPGADRVNRYPTAKSECEETLSWLRDSYRLGEIPAKDFFTFTNRGIVISRMIGSLVN